jgi:hypothetical protein
MDIEHVKEKVSAIERATDDPEKAHGLEDDLLREFVTWLAGESLSNPFQVQEIAREIERSLDLPFPRWSA